MESEELIRQIMNEVMANLGNRPDDGEKLLEKGAADFIAKPVAPDRLIWADAVFFREVEDDPDRSRLARRHLAGGDAGAGARGQHLPLRAAARGGAAGAHRPAQLHRRTAGGKQADGRRHDAQELAPHAGPAAVPRTADGGFRRHWRRREPAVAHRALLDLKAAATTVGPAQFRFLNTAAAFRITRRPALPRIGRIDVRFNHSP